MKDLIKKSKAILEGKKEFINEDVDGELDKLEKELDVLYKQQDDIQNKIEKLQDKMDELDLDEAFMRLPSTVIGTDLYVLQRDLKDFLYRQMNNNDFNPKQFDDIIKRMQKIKKSAKKFNKASDMGPEFRYRS